VPLLLRFRSEDLLQCRFAISPLNETADALRSLARSGAAAYHLPWQRQARELVPGLGIEPLLAILAVHEHLGVLRANGLVSTTRTGRFLVHHRTTLGLALAGD
jgi:hypothetical protein